MRKLRSLVVLAFLGFLLLLIALPYVQKLRVGHSRDYCKEHQRQIWSAMQTYKLVVAGPERREVSAYPPGTMVVPTLPAEERLSWLVGLLAQFDQTRYPADKFANRFRFEEGWKPHREAGQQRLALALCPGSPALGLVDDLAATQYVGLAGLAPNGATLPDSSPRAGAFRYDAATPYESFTDGLSSTAVLGEVSQNLGGWIRGGPSTLRDLDPSKPPYIGPGGQFGGLHPVGMNLQFADGSSRFLTERTSGVVLQQFFTLNGGPAAILPD